MDSEKIAKSHFTKLSRMLSDLVRASKDIEGLRHAYLQIANEFLNTCNLERLCVDPAVPGQLQAGRCWEILNEHVALKSDIDSALQWGTDGKRVATLQLQLDTLEDERDSLDAGLRSTRRYVALHQVVATQEPPLR